MWNRFVFRMIREQFGGLIGIARSMVECTNLESAPLKVRGDAKEFFHEELTYSTSDGPNRQGDVINKHAPDNVEGMMHCFIEIAKRDWREGKQQPKGHIGDASSQLPPRLALIGIQTHQVENTLQNQLQPSDKQMRKGKGPITINRCESKTQRIPKSTDESQRSHEIWLIRLTERGKSVIVDTTPTPGENVREEGESSDGAHLRNHRELRQQIGVMQVYDRLIREVKEEILPMENGASVEDGGDDREIKGQSDIGETTVDMKAYNNDPDQG
ncbi:hypothetical protein Syun_021530 [Stephania yunnanensis]|uniref:Uncharacterized protein n=1 Tax=Stephania yunnanensis TaxID=152371 RepID=A0AAP0IFX6_9MAGN